MAGGQSPAHACTCRCRHAHSTPHTHVHTQDCTHMRTQHAPLQGRQWSAPPSLAPRGPPAPASASSPQPQAPPHPQETGSSATSRCGLWPRRCPCPLGRNPTEAPPGASVPSQLAAETPARVSQRRPHHLSVLRDTGTRRCPSSHTPRPGRPSPMFPAGDHRAGVALPPVPKGHLLWPKHLCPPPTSSQDHMSLCPKHLHPPR